ncbi:DNA polymerase III subunit epsilon [Bacteroidia bacterium]|nr:DNA polymerase III subunit epsilon [Bacteroidia bacterium]
MLTLTKPLCFFDLETTGIDIKTAKIIEITVLKVNTDCSRNKPLTQRFNPGCPIPAEASAVHGIFDADVANEPTFKDFAHELLKFIGDSDMAGYNSNNYDRPILEREFNESGVQEFTKQKRYYVDACSIFKKMEPRNLSAAYKFFCGKELENAHSAEADTIATYEVFMAQIEKYKGMEVPFSKDNERFPDSSSIEDIAKFTAYKNADNSIIKDNENNLIINFGKYKNKLLKDIYKNKDFIDYLEWMKTKDFNKDTIDAIEKAISNLDTISEQKKVIQEVLFS